MTKVLALCYHDIYSNNDILLSGFNEGGSNLYKIKDYDFEAQLKSLISTKDIEIILVNQVRDSKSNNKNILLTFDDGGITSYTKIFPLLEKYGIKGHFFIVGNKIGKKGFVDANQLREIRSYGHIIGTHSFSHPDNITLLSSMDIKNEWKNGVKAIEQRLGDIFTDFELITDDTHYEHKISDSIISLIIERLA